MLIVPLFLSAEVQYQLVIEIVVVASIKISTILAHTANEPQKIM